MRRVQVQELKQWLDEGKAVQMVDTREEEEFKIAAIGGSDRHPKAAITGSLRRIGYGYPGSNHLPFWHQKRCLWPVADFKRI
ncbi:MAG: hypothetical protein U5L09_02595 [Bacteroidales bacterium]|nr:hypothetical protein [Bacteroidales bacterium]